MCDFVYLSPHKYLLKLHFFSNNNINQDINIASKKMQNKLRYGFDNLTKFAT